MCDWRKDFKELILRCSEVADQREQKIKLTENKVFTTEQPSVSLQYSPTLFYTILIYT